MDKDQHLIKVIGNLFCIKFMITIESIMDTFTKMTNKGVNVNKKLLWGYFFVSSQKEYLKKIIELLKEKKYTYNNLYQNDTGSYTLNMEKIETNTPNSLFSKCEELNQIANSCGVSYDGYDVGNPDRNKPITEVV